MVPKRRREHYLRLIQEHGGSMSLREIADRYGVSYDMLRKANHLLAKNLKAEAKREPGKPKRERKPEAETKYVPVSASNAFGFTILKLYQGDEKVFDDAQILGERFVPEPEIKSLITAMRVAFESAYAISARVFDKGMQELYIKRGERNPDVRVALANIEEALERYAPLVADEMFKVPYLETAMEVGVFVYARLMARAYFILYLIFKRIKEALNRYGHGVSLIPQLVSYSRNFEAGVYKGISKPVEEMDVTQFTASQILSDQPAGDSDMERFIDLSMDIVAHQLCSVLSPEVMPYLVEARRRRQQVINIDFVKRRIAWLQALVEGGPSRLTLTVKPAYLQSPFYSSRIARFSLAGSYPGIRLCRDFERDLVTVYPTPLFFIPRRYWKFELVKDEAFPSNALSGRVELLPAPPKNLPIMPRGKEPLLNMVLATIGAGKTVLLDALRYTSIERYRMNVIRPTMPREQELLSALPLLPYNNAAKQDFLTLTERYGVMPRTFPDKAVRFISVIDDDSQLNPDSPLTVYDRIIHVDDISDFKLDWNRLMFAKGGAINFRPHLTTDTTETMLTQLVRDLFAWRTYRRHVRVRLQVDEVHQLIPSVTYGTEAQLAHAVQKVFVNIRGLNIPCDLATQRPVSIDEDVLQKMTAVFWSKMLDTKDPSKSPRQQILTILNSTLSDREKMVFPTVLKIMENRNIGKPNYLMFMAYRGTIRLVRAVLPPHMIESTTEDLRRIFEIYEKASGEKVLATKTEVLKMSEKEFGRKPTRTDRKKQPSILRLDG